MTIPACRPDSAVRSPRSILRRRRGLRLPALTAALVFAAACPPPRAPGPLAALEEATRQAGRPDATARAIALSGFHAYLTGAPEEASSRFDRALETGPDPYALMGRLLLARRAGHLDRGMEAALGILRHAPEHPLAAAAGRYVLDLTGTSEALDEQILELGAEALGQGLAGDAAQLLRSAQMGIFNLRGDLERRDALLAEMGMPAAYTLLGPLSAYNVLEFDRELPPERGGALEADLEGPFGPVTPRALPAPDGRFELDGERADLYLLAVDLTVTRPGDHVVRTVSTSPHALSLGGTRLFERRSFERTLSTVTTETVKLPAGEHRLLLKIASGPGGTGASVALFRADGEPSGITFEPASGPAPSGAAPKRASAPGVYPTAASFAEGLLPETGEALALYLGVRDGLGRDADGARGLTARLSELLTGSTIEALRVDVESSDRTVPPRIARGRATRDLEAALEKDPAHVHLLLAQAKFALDDGRLQEAALGVTRAKEAQPDVGAQVHLFDARVQQALQLDAQADRSAQQALAVHPGLCEALRIRYELARRRDAVALADELVGALGRCPGAAQRRAEHLRTRGDVEGALGELQALHRKEPGQLGPVFALASAHAALERYDEALSLLDEARGRWPRNPLLPKRMSEVADLAGQPDRALALAEQSLALDGGDLSLRRKVARARTGQEPLEQFAFDGHQAIAAYEAKPGREDTPSVYILDSAVVEAFSDGSMLDRVHIIQKAVQQGGVQGIAEATIPRGAQVLRLRTIKADGTVLEPEQLENKDTISLPGVQVGDYVEQEYLLGHSSRGPAMPGFTASSFFFQIPNMPNFHAVYRVLAPKGAGLAVDARNMTASPVRVEGDREVFFHEEHRVPAHIPEPDSPPSGTEYLPFVTVGAGTRGNEELVAAYADAYLDRGRLTYEVERFAREAVGAKEGLDAVRALHAAVMEKILGGDSGITHPASATLAQERGSRLWLLKAGLEAEGILARLAVVRTHSADPAEHLFPTGALLPYVCLRVEVPGAAPLWLDTMVRFGPFGELPEQASGQEAFLLPEPGLPLQKLTTPESGPKGEKRVRLTAALSADGRLTGKGEESYTGFEGARVAQALEDMPPHQRQQALQGALSRYFGGAELSSLEIKLEQAVGAPVVIRYDFTAPNFARAEEGRLMMGALTFPAQLGRRYVQRASRQTPLYIAESSRSVTTVELTLPPGFTAHPDEELRTQSAFGEFVRRERVTGGVFRVEEELLVKMSRVAPDEYNAFATFAGEVDLLQSRDFALTAVP